MQKQLSGDELYKAVARILNWEWHGDNKVYTEQGLVAAPFAVETRTRIIRFISRPRAIPPRHENWTDAIAACKACGIFDSELTPEGLLRALVSGQWRVSLRINDR